MARLNPVGVSLMESMKLFPGLLVALGGPVKATAPDLGLEEVVLCCFSDSDLRVYERLVAQRGA